MKDVEIRMNLVAQGKAPLDGLLEWFRGRPEEIRSDAMRVLYMMLSQVHPREDEFSRAVALSGIAPGNGRVRIMSDSAMSTRTRIDRLLNCHNSERDVVFKLGMQLFTQADTRRRTTLCASGCAHWWHNLDANTSQKFT